MNWGGGGVKVLVQIQHSLKCCYTFSHLMFKMNVTKCLRSTSRTTLLLGEKFSNKGIWSKHVLELHVITARELPYGSRMNHLCSWLP